jgi:phosphoribosylformylglycinamidine cyclo-ligase
VLGLASTGVHSNGFSLVRRILSDARVALDARPPELGGRAVAEVLLEPTRIYVKDVLALLEAVEVKGLAHVTGSGIPGNVPRCLPEGTRAVLEVRRWPRPAVFDWLQRLGGVSDAEMDSTFNMGLGMVAVVPPAAVKPALALLTARGVPAWEVGRIEPSTGEPTAVVVR